MNPRFYSLLFIFFVLGAGTAIAQRCLWARNAGHTYNSLQWITSATDAAGNVYLTGSFDGTGLSLGTTMIFGGGTHNFFVAKYSSTGSVIWSKGAIGAIGTITSIAVDNKDHIYIAGSYTDTAVQFGYTILKKTTPQPNLFLVKLKSLSGAEIWTKTTTGDNEATSVAVDTTGNIYMTGIYRSSSITFGATTLTNSLTGKSDVFLAKYDSLGNVLWARGGAASTDDDNVASVATDISGNAFVTGHFRSAAITFGATTLLNFATGGGSNDIFLVKYDPAGNVTWAKGMGGNNNDRSMGVSCDAAGNSYITGDFQSVTTSFGTTTLTNASSGTSDMFVAKHDPGGIALWAKSAGGPGAEEAVSVANDPSGNVYVTGTYLSPSITFGSSAITNPGTSPYVFMTKYNSIGGTVWATNALSGTSAGFVAANHVTTDMTGAIYLTGIFASPTIIFDTVTLTKIPKFGNEFFVAKYDGVAVPSHTPVVHTTRNNINIYPNPATNRLTLDIPDQTEISSVTISDMLGRQVYYSPNYLSSPLSILLPELANGTYILRATGNNYTESVPFSVAK